MIIKDFQLDKIAKEHENFFGILVFGPNEGLVKEQVEKVTRAFSVKGECEIINFNGKDLYNDPLSLDNIVRTVSMFYVNKIIIKYSND